MKNRSLVAAKRYEEWHQKHPDKVICSKRARFPADAELVGIAVDILYKSDKWEEDGDFYEYTHDFSSKPQVFQGTFDPQPGVKTVTTPGLFGVQHLIGLHLVDLARVESLSMMTGDGEKVTLTFGGRMPHMRAPVGFKMVFIDDRIPFFIRGGKMIITKRGIIN